MRRCGSEKMNNYDRSTLLTEVSSGTGHELTHSFLSLALIFLIRSHRQVESKMEQF